MGDFAIYETPTIGDSDPITMRRRKRRSIQATPVASAREAQPLVIDIRHLAWQLDAACYGMNPELFFGQDQPVAQLREVCASCPVRQDCRDYADKHDLIGFWGGSAEYERRLAKRRARRAERSKTTDTSGSS